jgi:tetratricopeptide (TPR) repeat protein
MRSCFGCLALAGLLLAASTGHGQEAPAPCDAAPEVCGKQAFQAGIEAYERADFEAALQAFRQAQALKPHPVILFNVALAEAKTGLLLEAVQHFEQVFNDPNTPADKLDAARRERDRTTALLARVSIDRTDAQLMVDGTAAAGSPPTVRVNPGQHHVRVIVGPEVLVDREVDLRSGEHLQLSIAEPAVERPEPVAAAPPPPQPTVTDTPGGLSPAWVFAGAAATVALGGISVWSALDASSAYDDFEAEASTLTEREARERVDAGQSKDARTHVLLGVTAVVAIATGGIALWAVDWGGSEAQGAVILLGSPGVQFAGRF